MGPVWAYWAFPMERYCGDVVRNIRSRRFPYASINRYVTLRAQLTHIFLLYTLWDPWGPFFIPWFSHLCDIFCTLVVGKSFLVIHLC